MHITGLAFSELGRHMSWGATEENYKEVQLLILAAQDG